MSIIKPITSAAISALKPGQTIRDDSLKGFCARHRRKYITYFVHTRIHRKMTFFRIGYHGSPWTPEDARKRAAQILRQIAEGIDPRSNTNDPHNAFSFGEIFEKFIAAKVGHLVPGTILNYQLLANKHIIPYFKDRPLNSLSRGDIVAFHQSMTRIPGMANHALVLLSAVFTWAQVEGLRQNVPNPCAKIKKYKRESIARFLSTDDLGRLAEACRWALQSGLANPIQLSAILMLMFTGARRNEVFTLKREYVDRQRMVAYLPRSKTGPKVLPLNPHAMAILDSLPEADNNPYYFFGRLPGECITEVRRAWDAIRKRAKLEKFRLHDFRHSFASFAGDSGASAQAVGAVLGHASVETTKIYMHLFNNRATETSTAAANTIFSAFTQPPAACSSTKAEGSQSDITARGTA